MPSIDLWIEQKAREKKLKDRRNSIIRDLAVESFGPTDIAFIMNLNKSSVSRLLRLGKNVNYKSTESKPASAV